MRKAVMLVMLLSAASLLLANGKRIEQVEILFVTPPTFDELWKESDIVARARVTKTEMRAAERGPDLDAYVYNAATIDITDFYRGRFAKNVAREIVVAQRAGTLELPDRMIELTGQEPMLAGSEYVLFLRWNPPLGMYEVTVGPDGIYELKGGVVRPLSRSALARQKNGVKADRFLDELQSRKKSER